MQPSQLCWALRKSDSDYSVRLSHLHDPDLGAYVARSCPRNSEKSRGDKDEFIYFVSGGFFFRTVYEVEIPRRICCIARTLGGSTERSIDRAEATYKPGCYLPMIEAAPCHPETVCLQSHPSFQEKARMDNNHLHPSR